MPSFVMGCEHWRLDIWEGGENPVPGHLLRQIHRIVILGPSPLIVFLDEYGPDKRHHLG